MHCRHRPSPLVAIKFPVIGKHICFFTDLVKIHFWKWCKKSVMQVLSCWYFKPCVCVNGTLSHEVHVCVCLTCQCSWKIDTSWYSAFLCIVAPMSGPYASDALSTFVRVSWGLKIYKIVTWVTSDVGMPSTRLVWFMVLSILSPQQLIFVYEYAIYKMFGVDRYLVYHWGFFLFYVNHLVLPACTGNAL